MKTRWSRVLPAAAALTVAPLAAGMGQQSPDRSCSYTDCAVRVQYRSWGRPRLVQGAQDSIVAKFGLFLPPRIPLFAQSPDGVVRLLYSAYRASATRGTILGIGGAALLVAGMIVYQADRYNDMNRGVSLGLVLGGVALTIPAIISSRRGADYLQQTIWQYNRQFAR
jgi:hypothetical protein